MSFRSLHERGCFVIPNPWDAGSARYLARLGFQALASSSAALAFSLGRPDRIDSLALHEVLEHVEQLVKATPLPVNADFQSGYSATPEGVAENVRLCLDTGVAGLSIEDAAEDGLYELAEALERFRAARSVSPPEAVLTARCEAFLVGTPDPLGESIRRLQAYSEAGADVLFAPGVRTLQDIGTLVSALSPKPVNVLIGWHPAPSVSQLAKLGVRRVSTGSALARVAWTAFAQAAETLHAYGDFAKFEGIRSTAEVSRDLAG